MSQPSCDNLRHQCIEITVSDATLTAPIGSVRATKVVMASLPRWAGIPYAPTGTVVVVASVAGMSMEVLDPPGVVLDDAADLDDEVVWEQRGT